MLKYHELLTERDASVIRSKLLIEKKKRLRAVMTNNFGGKMFLINISRNLITIYRN